MNASTITYDLIDITNTIPFDFIDIDLGGILNVIAENVKRNASLIRNNVQIVELDFKAQQFSEALESVINDIDIVICADGRNFLLEKN